jgi:hypothetical protein
MATTYEWDIENVDLIDNHEGNENVVFRVCWKCTATSDSGQSKNQIGVIELNPTVDSDNFIPVEEVTKQNIIDWVKAVVPVSVIERDLNPGVTTITFMNTTGTSVTVADQIAAAAARQDQTPDPNNP